MAWPDYAQIIAPDQEIGQDSDVARDDFDDGFIRQERRFSRALRTWQITALLDTDDDLTRFREWARFEAHLWFAWTDSVSDAPMRVRVRGGAGGITYTAHVLRNRRRWELTLTLEGWPI